jgi:hypothetical protein
VHIGELRGFYFAQEKIRIRDAGIAGALIRGGVALAGEDFVESK